MKANVRAPRPTDLDTFAREYVNLLNSQPNGLGGHTHPIYGESHFMFGVGRQEFGEKAWDDAIDAAFAVARKARP